MQTNKIYCGDAYKLIKEIPGKSVQIIITDPPYQIEGLHTGQHGIFKHRGGHRYEEEMLEAGLHKGLDLSILDEFVRVMEKINIYIWCNKEQIYDYLTYFVEKKKCNWEILVWAKDNPPPFLNGHYLKDKEYCLYFWEKGVSVHPTWETGKTVMLSKVNITDKNDFGHPTIKPIEFIEKFLKVSANLVGGGLVFDPFCGSGTTCLAAKHMGLDYIGFEINPKYYQIAIDRLQGINQKGELNLFDIDYD